ncbi:putative Inner membrane metabolite transport protein YhjE [Arthrobacter sp. 9AX]|uniref:MFS transporter n=1 Tax=Arthrobacter sp. 9AX TaxID=2653131 RepID=UPI0012F01F44|nr:MFS transporter [Arthrobacter sp. 9AX]VXC12882.1 putative Inner membrane metabolite transport protein YhjE [Arthrobacter sp. 9AX]
MTALTEVPTRSKNTLSRVIAASMVGTVIEWYDFFIFGSMAALLLGPVFFPSDNKALSTMASMATFAVAFLIRPLGAVVLGHFGDKFGRRSTLVLALLLMGGSTLAVGLLPSYAQWGVAAPVLLILCRVLQGFALGGEYGGAVLMVVENADAKNKKGFYGAFLSAASPVGFLLATGVIALTALATTDEQMAAWGWRIPFLTSAIMVGIGLYIRLMLEESDAFKELQNKAETQEKPQQKVPFLDMFRKHPVEVLKSILVPIGVQAAYYMTTVFLLSFARNSGGFNVDQANSMVMIAAVAFLLFIFIGGYWSDRAPRWVPMSVGLGGYAVSIFLMFPMVQSGNYLLAAAAFVLGLAFVGLLYGPMSIYMAELFSGSVRYTGVSFGYQMASAITGGLTPVFSVALLEQTGSPAAVAGYAAVMMAIAFAGLMLRRTRTNWSKA